MPVFYRRRAFDTELNSITVRIFTLPEGLAGVVIWPLPEPGLRVFSPTVSQPEGVANALPYALFLSEHLNMDRIVVELDDGIEWQSHWGQLID